MNLAKCFYYGATTLSFCLLVASVLYGIFRASLPAKEHKWFLSYLCFILSVETISEIMVLTGKDNFLLYPFYISGEFFLLSAMFVLGLKLPRGLFFLLGIGSVFIFSEAMIQNSNNQSITFCYGKVFSHLVIICMSGYYLVQVVKNSKLHMSNQFLIVYGSLFLYYAVSLFLFLLMEELTNLSKQSAFILWGMNNILSASLYGASFYVFLRLKK